MGQNKFIGQIKEYNRYREGEVKEEFPMDLIDKKILYLLHENARYSNTGLAKRLKLKRETIAYRLKRMADQEFLHGYFTLLDSRKLGFKNYLVYFKLRVLTKEKEFLDYLFSIAEVIRLCNCSGSYDTGLVFSVKTEEEFIDCFEKITNKYYEVIQQQEIFEILEEDFLGLSMLLDNEEVRKLSLLEHKGSAFCKEMGTTSEVFKKIIVDDKDKSILELIKLNSRIPLSDLSNQVQIAPLAVKNRIKNMICTGIIKRFYPLTSLNKLGYQWWMVFFKVKNLDKTKFLTFLKYHSNVLWYLRLIGRWDYHISIFAKDNAEFHRILDEIRTEFAENIAGYDSVIIFNQFKYVQRVD